MTAVSKPRVLLLGPMPEPGTAIGGTQVSFGAFVRQVLARGELDVVVHSTSRSIEPHSRARRLAANGRTLARTILALAREGRGVDAVAFHASPGALLAAGPIVWSACRALRKPLCVRAFGGSLDLALDAAPRPLRALFDRTVLRSDLVLLQTPALLDRFGVRANVRWLPTTRDVPPRTSPRARRCTRFLFLAQLRADKGIVEALRASDALSGEARLDVCGPPMPGFDAASIDGHPRARYLGPIEQGEVARVLSEHDALVFPSYYHGEGLPGAVLEALQLGLPVIGTQWRSIPDVVAHESNGLLVPPRDVGALAAAMRRLADDGRLFRALSDGALQTGATYRAAPWQARHEGWLADLCRGRTPANGPLPASHAPSITPARSPRALRTASVRPD